MSDYERTTRGTAPDTSSDSPPEERLQALFAAADPQGEPSDALVRRVTELRTRPAVSPQPARCWWPLSRTLRESSPLRERTAIRVARWCAAGVALLALVSFWPMGQPDLGAVEAAMRATTAAPAMHVVGRGTTENQELWFVAGAGCYLYGKNPKYETILVDDMKHQYRYEIRERRVYVTASLLADPEGVSRFWETHSGSGLLRDMLRAWGRKNVSVETVTRDGRTLRQLVGPRRITRITIDPETDRILMVDVDAPQPNGTKYWTRYDFEYPDPRTVDRSYFQFKMPKGVTVVDQTGQR